jgi:hypothetical protein
VDVGMAPSVVNQRLSSPINFPTTDGILITAHAHSPATGFRSAATRHAAAAFR